LRYYPISQKVKRFKGFQGPPRGFGKQLNIVIYFKEARDIKFDGTGDISTIKGTLGRNNGICLWGTREKK